MVIMFTLLYIVFALLDVIPMFKNKQWKVLVIYSVLIITAYTLTVLTEFGVKIPSPAVPLKQIITSITGK